MDTLKTLAILAALLAVGCTPSPELDPSLQEIEREIVEMLAQSAEPNAPVTWNLLDISTLAIRVQEESANGWHLVAVKPSASSGVFRFAAPNQGVSANVVSNQPRGGGISAAVEKGGKLKVFHSR